MGDFWVNGIVSARDGKPYLQLSNEKGMIAQLSMAQARVIALDILQMSARTEADAMIHKFFSQTEHPAVSDSIMLTFREFRAELDREAVEHSQADPDGSSDMLDGV